MPQVLFKLLGQGEEGETPFSLGFDKGFLRVVNTERILEEMA